MPTAILLGVTGVSRAGALVLDVQNGYFDRLRAHARPAVRHPARAHGRRHRRGLRADGPDPRSSGFLLGVRFETGVARACSCSSGSPRCGASRSPGFGYAIALKTGNPAAVKSSFLLFFPFLFLTSSYVPRAELSGWLDTVAAWNPVTYLLEGMRSLAMIGWDGDAIGEALLAVGIVAAISMTLCFAALRGRIKRG